MAWAMEDLLDPATPLKKKARQTSLVGIKTGALAIDHIAEIDI
jgi:hypothetical protein